MEKDTATGTRQWSRHKDIMRCCNIMVPKNPPSPSTPTVEGRELFPAPSDGERGVVKGDGAESADRHWEGVAAGRGHPPPYLNPIPRSCATCPAGGDAVPLSLTHSHGVGDDDVSMGACFPSSHLRSDALQEPLLEGPFGGKQVVNHVCRHTDK